MIAQKRFHVSGGFRPWKTNRAPRNMIVCSRRPLDNYLRIIYRDSSGKWRLFYFFFEDPRRPGVRNSCVNTSREILTLHYVKRPSFAHHLPGCLSCPVKYRGNFAQDDNAMRALSGRGDAPRAFMQFLACR